MSAAQPSAIHKRTSARVLLALIGVGALGAALAYGLTRPAAPARAGMRAPSFELPLLGGGGTLSSDDLAGKAVVLNFWASWCGPCREEAPALQAAWERHRADGLVIVGVNTRDAEPAALDFVDEFGLTYPMVRDEDQVLVRALGLVGLPQTFFITHDWRLLASAAGEPIGNALGAIEPNELEARIEDLLELKQGAR
jgi:cytochrome c biogenesis protein CcmG/thiol:disulfide interchange protein DsbE